MKPTVIVHGDRVEIHGSDGEVTELTPVVFGQPLEFAITDEKGHTHFSHGERPAEFLRRLKDIEGINLAEMLRMQVDGVNVTFTAPAASPVGEGIQLRWDDEETVLYDADISFLDSEEIGLLRVNISENEISHLNAGMQSKLYDGEYDRSVDFLVDLNRMASDPCLDEDDALKWADFFEALAAKLRAGGSGEFAIRPVRVIPKTSSD